MNHDLTCPVCKGASSLLDVVDFNKSCEESRGRYLPLVGMPIYYALCDSCGFCFAPEFGTWSSERFSQLIYNEDYIQVDPDYVDARPRGNAASLLEALGRQRQRVDHLDYGSGAGVLSQLLRDAGWQSRSYDPFVQTDVSVSTLAKANLITAYEVFEHVQNPHQLMRNLGNLLADEGLILFSTLVSDGNIARNQRLNWWYAAPRNGHISLFSKQSLFNLATDHGFQWASFSDGHHTLFRKVPSWASHLIASG